MESRKNSRNQSKSSSVKKQGSIKSCHSNHSQSNLKSYSSKRLQSTKSSTKHAHKRTKHYKKCSRTILITTSVLLFLFLVIFILYLMFFIAATTTAMFNFESLNEHNILRAKHFSPPLELDPQIIQTSQLVVNSNAQDSLINSSKLNKNFLKGIYIGYGENDYRRKLMAPSLMPSGTEITDYFYNNQCGYDYVNPCKCRECDYFTQLVWKNTSKMGCAFNVTRGTLFVTCLYSPTGNIEGQYSENVLPPA